MCGIICQALLLLQAHAVIGINFDRLVKISEFIRSREEILSVVMFSQKSFVEQSAGFDAFIRWHSTFVPVLIIGGNLGETNSLSPLLGDRSMSFIFMDKIKNERMLKVVNQSMQYIHSSKMVFVLQSLSEDEDVLLQFFRTCLQLGIVNIIVMHDSQVMSYKPFPIVSLHNLTGSLLEDYFPDRLYDLEGYTFYTPLLQDGSRVFIYRDKSGAIRTTGVNAEIFRAFVHRHNATFKKLENATHQSSFDVSDGFNLLAQRKVDILLHTFSYFNPDLFAWSYPIAQVQWQAVVPYVGEIPASMYLILPFESKVWLCLGGSFIYISLVSYLVLRYCRILTEYGPVFSRSLTQLLYMPTISMPPTLRAVVLELQIFCYGLIFTNVYLAFLSAFLTTTVQGKQIDTFEELFQSGLKILTSTFEASLIRGTDVFHSRHSNIFRIEDIDFVEEYRKSLNRTYAFVIADDKAKFFLGQQKYLKKKHMHVSRRPLAHRFLTFSMQMDSPFRSNFDAILLQLYQTGLFKKWETDVFDMAVATNYLQLFRSSDEDSFRPLRISHLFVCWMTFVLGIGVSLLIFSLELVRYKVRK